MDFNSIENDSSTLNRNDQLNKEQDNPNQFKSGNLSGTASTYNINIETELQQLEPANIGMEENPAHGLLPIANIRSQKIVENESRRVTNLDEDDTK